MREKILLDTDIGNDIDDSVCLAYLLKQPKCDLLGITTVSGQPVERARLASVICLAAGRGDIPIYPGAEAPLLITQKQAIAHQAAKLGGWSFRETFPEGEAVEFMRRTIRANPHEITLMAIGPMTNVALLFAVDAEIPKLLKGLVVMCGVFTYRYMGGPCLSEWNARCDPHAAAMVYAAPVKNIMSVGLDVTSEVRMGGVEIEKNFTSDILKVVLAFSGIAEGTRKDIVFHDPLAAAAFFERGICRFERGVVGVEHQSGRLEGLTYWQPDANGKDEIALGVDRDAFFAHYFKIVNNV
jgi:inosine-uridine nucleoside N-ribohydrolase